MTRNLNRLAAATAVLLLAVMAAFTAWRVIVPPDVAHLAIVVDRSESPAFPVCDAVASVVRMQLALPNTVKESKQTLIATGDARNDFHGRFVRRWSLPKKIVAIRSPKKQVSREQGYIKEVAESCEDLDKVDRSPIVSAIAAAVADLRALGCPPRAGCRVDVVSDGNENVDLDLARALKGDERAARKRGPVIDNKGIEVAFCGISQAPRVQNASPKRDDGDAVSRMRRVWSVVFTDPELFAVRPFCQDDVVSASVSR